MVDSDPERLSVVRGAMRRRADVFLSAASASEARRCLEACAIPIDWILIDLAEADNDRLALAEELNQTARPIGIVLTVDRLFDCNLRQLRKPYGVQDLWTALQ
jgi:CheY-like chemotaxis protein